MMLATCSINRHSTSPPASFRDLRRLESQKHTSQLDFIAVMQRRGSLSGQPLAIEEREIRTVFILYHVLAILNKDASVQAGNTPFFTPMWGKIDIGEDVAHSILAPNHHIVFAANVELLIVGLNDQACLHSCRSGCWRWSRCRFRCHTGCGGCCRNLCRSCWRSSRSRGRSRCTQQRSATVRAESLTRRIHCSAGWAWLLIYHSSC